MATSCETTAGPVSGWPRLGPVGAGGRTLVRDCARMLAGATGLAAAQVVWNALAARSLGPHGYGVLSFVLANTALASTMVGASLGLCATRYVAAFEAPSRRRQVGASLLQIAVLVGLAGMVTAVVGAAPLARRAGGLEGQEPLLRWAGVLFAAAVAAAVANGILSGSAQFRQVATVYLTQGLLTVALMVVAYWRAEAGWAMAAVTAGAVAAAAVGVRGAIHALGNGAGGFGWDPEIGPILWRHAGPSLIGGLVVHGGTLWANWMLLAQGGAAEVAWFQAANQWRALVLFAPSALSPVLVARLAALGESDRQRRAGFANYRATALAAGVAALLLILGAGGVAALYGPAFGPARAPLVLVAWAFFFAAINNTAGHQLNSQASHWTSLALNLVYTGGLLGAVQLGSPRLTAVRMAGALLAASFLQWVASGVYWATIFDRRQRREAVAVPLALAAGLAAATAWVWPGGS